MDEYLKHIIIRNFKDDIVSVSNIYGGWLTEKRKVQFKNKYSIMIKIIADKKINRRNIDVELAYTLQDKAYEYGIKCPKIFKIDNNLVNYNDLGNPIIVTEYIENTFLKDYTNINKSDIFNLGIELAQIRNCFNSIELNKKVDFENLIKKINNDYKKRLNDGKTKNNDKFLKDVLKQKKIIDSLDYNFLTSLEVGYCHGDLSQDNILFDDNGFRAIVDFELSNVSFVLIDIARVFLTFCLDNNGNINKELLNELLRGYNTLKNITINELVVGLKILWYLEVGLWSKESYYINNNPEKVNKFIFEINWITENWFNMDEIFNFNQ